MQPLSSYAAIIWDCDGVLIDSEILACGACVDILRAHGAKITLEEYLIRFMGKSNAQMLAEINFLGEFPSAEIKEKLWPDFKNHLKAIPGVQDFLDSVSLPMAVASGSSADRLAYTLDLTGLAKYFGQHVYSSDLVRNGKPAPDIFLLAAEKLSVKPEDCLVIEDSPHGLRGAKAAGMTAYAFTGGSHISPAIRQSLIDAGPDYIFDNMNQLITTQAAA